MLEWSEDGEGSDPEVCLGEVGKRGRAGSVLKRGGWAGRARAEARRDARRGERESPVVMELAPRASSLEGTTARRRKRYRALVW